MQGSPSAHGQEFRVMSANYIVRIFNSGDQLATSTSDKNDCLAGFVETADGHWRYPFANSQELFAILSGNRNRTPLTTANKNDKS
jgi:hypothetical protein